MVIITISTATTAESIARSITVRRHHPRHDSCAGFFVWLRSESRDYFGHGNHKPFLKGKEGNGELLPMFV